ncbi:glycoside hydrolase family 23 protein [Laetiporus sulphureus 93-53]|uniref:Glycoside hydrolase family 23 protein n=1 Tax=Laetiporus sulphureus 93-53 TaxID=1314785 RepID=A0A165EJQ4_9APHY|nr:glycoside hydrolase family 23 protein [Laetiporus sulphureus 93-53]KZT07194.1 glycoside hydrolase family 23 protein [Laetiporus sulphureus 93-53]
MHFVAPLILLLLTAASAQASLSHFHVAQRQGQHARLARRARSVNGRCGAQPKLQASNGDATQNSHNTTASVALPVAITDYQSASNSPGVINVQSSCGPTGATPYVTPTSGPNGDIDWLNCGINDGGWRPPDVKISDIITKALTITNTDSDNAFQPCAPYVELFEQHANETGIPSILLAAIAMQESECNADTEGGAGEQGLMQLTQDKCGDAPNGNCKDPRISRYAKAYNIRTGAHYFSSTLQNNGGNLLLTLGNYNGWPAGMTYGQATAAANTDCCRCQNNLDYLQQMLNGWLQNKNPYSSNPRIGKYFNLDKCWS